MSKEDDLIELELQKSIKYSKILDTDADFIFEDDERIELEIHEPINLADLENLKKHVDVENIIISESIEELTFGLTVLKPTGD